jgi:hypothetical protein
MDEEEQLERQKLLLPEILDEPREENVEQEHVDWISFCAFVEMYLCVYLQ